MSRQSRVTADITLEAHNILREYCDKHERSKGYLLEKMIRKFCVDVTDTDVVDIKKQSTSMAVIEKPAKTKRFIKPTPVDVAQYMDEKAGLGIKAMGEANSFYDFYESKGWVVGKVKMKCWKAAVRNWLKGAKDKPKSTTKNTVDLEDRSWADEFKIRVKK